MRFPSKRVTAQNVYLCEQDCIRSRDQCLVYIPCCLISRSSSYARYVKSIAVMLIGSALLDGSAASVLVARIPGHLLQNCAFFHSSRAMCLSWLFHAAVLSVCFKARSYRRPQQIASTWPGVVNADFWCNRLSAIGMSFP